MKTENSDKGKIIIIDDNRDLAENIEDILAGKGFAIDKAYTGKSAIDKFQNVKYDIALVDIKLPDTDGLELIEKINKISPATVYLVITGHESLTSAMRSVKIAQVISYETKPLDFNNIIPLISQILDKKKLEEKFRESEERYRRLFETAQDGMLILDATTGIIKDANPFIKNILGYKIEELVGRQLWEIGTFRDIVENKEKLRTLQNQGYMRYENLPLKSSSGEEVHVEFVSNTYKAGDKKVIQCNIRDITERKQAEERQNLHFKLLNILNQPGNLKSMIREILLEIKKFSGIEAVGIRLQEGKDYPYIETNGFPERFVELERYLCSRDENGEIERDAEGNPYLECMCGNVVCGRTDPSYEFFTEDGSFWSNNTTKLLAETSEEERQARTRNRCNGEGYESVALVPLKSGKEIVGLLQFNDRRTGRFTREFIEYFENIGDSIGIAFSIKLAEEELQRTNQQLTASEQQLRAANQQLAADEQQIKASNQQLLDSEQAIRETEEFTKRIIASSRDCINVLDLEGNLISMSEGGQELLEIDNIEPYLNKSWVDFWKGDDHKAALKAISAAKKGGVGKFSGYCETENGTPKWWEIIITPINDANNKLQNLLAISRDVTERKRNKQIQDVILNISNAVAKSDNPVEFIMLVKNELETIIDTSNFYVTLYDEPTDSIDLLYHKDKKDKIKTFPAGKTLTKYVIKTKKSLLATKVVKDKLVRTKEIELLGADSKVWLGVPLITGGKVSGVIAVQSYEDEKAYNESDMRTLEIISYQLSISLERKKAEQDLRLALEKAEESNRLKTAFLNNMSHEIRTPLNGITGFIEILQEPEIDDEDKQEYFNIINKNSDRLIATVTDIMDISRIEAGEVKVTKTEVSVNEILEEQYNFFKPDAESKGLRLFYESTLSDKEARFVTDKNKMEGILTNLIKNAIKYTEQGKITFTCSLKKEQDFEVLEFYVKDTGIGIPANRKEAVFNRFEQADIGDSRAHEGSGLGLAISKSYVEMLGGKIWVESEVGVGSQFYFTIPYKTSKTKVSEDKEIVLQETPQINPEVSGLKILIVEDEESGFELLSVLLRDVNKELLHTKTGTEAVDYCRSNPDIDLVLMDIRMPGMDGYEATKQIREFNKELIIIAQTAYGLMGDREKAIESGCNDYIAKPIKKMELHAMIQKYFGK